MLFCTLPTLSPFLSPGSCQASTHRACPQQRLSSSRHSIASTFSYARRPRGKLITAMITTKQFKTVCSLATPFAGDTQPRESWCWFQGRRIFLQHHSYWRNSTERFWGNAVLCYVCLSVEAQAPLGGSPSCSSADAWARPPAFLWNSPHSWLRETRLVGLHYWERRHCCDIVAHYSP